MGIFTDRFYDPLGGEILLDGVAIDNVQLRWLRSQMGLVSQEPALFATTIKENILFGKEDADMDEVVAAAKASNAHNFISQLPQGYDTQVVLLVHKLTSFYQFNTPQKLLIKTFVNFHTKSSYGYVEPTPILWAIHPM